MSVIIFLIPLGLLLLGIAVWAFLWAVDHGQFEDLDRAGQSILFDDDELPPSKTHGSASSDSSTDSTHDRGAEGSADEPGSG
jgi:cbb3-type cytochrome oxidase maturation protein